MKKDCFLTAVLFIFLSVNAFTGFAQSTYTWNSTATADWTVATNWVPTRTTPAANDILQFNNGATTTATNIPTETIGQLLISNGTAVSLQTTASGNTLTIGGVVGNDDLVVNTGATLNSNGSNDLTILIATGATATISGNINFSTAPHKLNAADVSGVVFNSPAVFTQDIGCSGNVFTSAGTSKAVVFNSGTTFLQKAGANPFALSQPSSKVVFNKGSLFKMQSNLFLSFSGRTYADLEINLASFNQSLTGTNACNINNLIITQGTLNLNLTGGINIKENISVASGAILGFNPATSNTLSFNGTTSQSITNAGTLTFNNNEAVVFNNAAGITINNDIVLNNSVTFTNGVVKTVNPAMLILSSTASVASVSNTSFVDGFVKKIGNTAFTFPVGRSIMGFSGYVPIQISAPASITDEYIAAYNRSSAVSVNNNYVAGVDHVSGVDYWTLSRTSGTTAVDVTLNWTNESSNGGSTQYINDKSKLVVAHYNGSTQWDAYGAVGAAVGGFGAGSITWTSVNLFSPSPNLFSLASTDVASNALPINLNYLNGHTQSNTSYLEWKITCSASTVNAIMEIERSADGQNFISINNITATAVRCQQPFNYIDVSPLNGMNYYRLKMTDSDGRVTYSSIITLVNKSINVNSIMLVPNLVTTTSMLNITAGENTAITVGITDCTGKLVQRKTYTLITGNNHFTINLVNLAPGVYQVTGYFKNGQRNSVRFVKK